MPSYADSLAEDLDLGVSSDIWCLGNSDRMDFLGFVVRLSRGNHNDISSYNGGNLIDSRTYRLGTRR
ncbi:hypothetical protein Bca4012_018471 [Brassica carinata]